MTTDEPMPAGSHEVAMHFAYDGGGLGKGGTVTLLVDGAEHGTGRLEETVGYIYSGDETIDVGCDTGTPVSPDCGPRDNEYTGAIEWVRIDLGDDDHSHLQDPDQKMNIAMMKQ